MSEYAGRRSPGESLFAWQDALGELTPARAQAGAVAVADSWLVDNGRVRHLGRHLDRFSASCQTRYGVSATVLARFLAAVPGALPVTGRWFPRIEFAREAGLRLRLRTAPARGGEVVLWVADKPDNRAEPTVKGPDLDLLAALREAAAQHGAHEALLTTSSGVVLEGALSSVLWWRDDILCAPPLSLPVLPGVTRAILLSIAAEAGTEIRYETCRPAELDGAETWAVSALHGIRAVAGWAQSGHQDGRAGGLTAGTARRARSWQARLAATATPISPSAIANNAHGHPTGQNRELANDPASGLLCQRNGRVRRQQAGLPGDRPPGRALPQRHRRRRHRRRGRP